VHCAKGVLLVLKVVRGHLLSPFICLSWPEIMPPQSLQFFPSSFSTHRFC
jgi:hypothetical protein